MFDKDHPENPCDYCAARHLICGEKVPTERKQREQAERLQASMTIGQPSLQLAIPHGHVGTGASIFNLSSASSDRNPLPFAVSTRNSPPAYSTLATGLVQMTSSLSLGVMPQPPYQNASSPTSPWQPFVFGESPEIGMDAISLSPDISSIAAFSVVESPHPSATAQAIFHGIMPIASTAIPHYPASDSSTDGTSSRSGRVEKFNPQQEYQIMKKIHLNTEILPRFVRTKHLPTNKRGRKFAGNWEEEADGAERRKSLSDSVQVSTKSAPSILVS